MKDRQRYKKAIPRRSFIAFINRPETAAFDPTLAKISSTEEWRWVGDTDQLATCLWMKPANQHKCYSCMPDQVLGVSLVIFWLMDFSGIIGVVYYWWSSTSILGGFQWNNFLSLIIHLWYNVLQTSKKIYIVGILVVF